VKSYEIYKSLDPAIVNEMLTYFRDEDREVYKTSLATLAQSKKLRAQFVQKKPIAEQMKWMHQTLKFKQNSEIGEHLLQMWFMKAKSEILVTACDTLEIKHNGEGFVEGNLPEVLEDNNLQKAVDTLLEKYGNVMTTLYLRVFNLQVPNGWSNLSAILESDERLTLQA